jgi:hypothetical protein
VQGNHGEYSGFIDGYKVRYFPWIDGKSYYFNVQYFKPGSNSEKPPQWDKSMLIKSWDGENVISIIRFIVSQVMPERAAISGKSVEIRKGSG